MWQKLQSAQFESTIMLKRELLICAVLTLLAVVTSAAHGKEETRPRPDMLVTTAWLADHLHDADLVVLCVADDERFYSAGHIPGARLISLSQIVTTRDGVPNQLPSALHLQKVFEDAGVSDGSRIVLYGERSGVMAARAYFTLDYLGLGDRATLLDGGIEKWRAEGRPVSTEAPQSTADRLQIRVRPEILVDHSRMLEYSQSGNVVLLDARPTPEYTGENLSEDVAVAGHIPGARSLFWHDLLRSDELPELISVSELRIKFEEAGASPGKELITYCRTGMQSSYDYFVAKYLGYSPKMYVGSFYEWSRRGDRVIGPSGHRVK